MSFLRSSAKLVRFAFLFLLMLASLVPTCLPNSSTPIDEDNIPRGSEQNEVSVEVLVKLSESCSLLDLNVENLFFCKISAYFTEPLQNSSQLSLYLPTTSTTFIATATYRDGNQLSIQPTLVPIGYGAETVPIFYFDDGLIGFEITMVGRLEGLSLLWRNMVDLRLIAPDFSYVIPVRYQIQIEVPNTLEVTSISSSEVQSLKLVETLGENSKVYTLQMPTGITVYYRPSYWLISGIVVLCVIVCASMLLPYFLHKKRPSSATRITKKIGDAVGFLRQSLKVERLFTFYILCSMLMLSLSLVAGPDPRIKMYAVAPPYMASTLERDLTNIVGPVQIIGPQDTVSEFETMANLGVIKAVIVSYYPRLALDRVVRYTFEAMKQVPLIIVDESMADPELARNLKIRYGDKVVTIQGTNTASLMKISGDIRDLRVENPLGLKTQIGPFKAATAAVAVLSFLVAFFGLAFLSSRLMEVGRSRGIGSIPEAIMLSAFVFYFTQAVYMTSSVLLATPIGLHAVTSGSRELTAVGLLGFGGGSSPRAISGMLGFFLGALIAIRGRSELDSWGITTFVVLMTLLLIDPFTGGEIFYDALLFFLSGPRSEIVRTSIFYTKDILSTMGKLFGGWVTGIYALSTGEILFYAGALPIFLFPILKRSTATSLLLICGIAAGSGFIRTAEMTPYKTVASLIPGLTVGLAVAAVFIAISFVEGHIRARF